MSAAPRTIHDAVGEPSTHAPVIVDLECSPPARG